MNEKYSFTFECTMAGKFELKIMEKNSNSIIYNGKITVNSIQSTASLTDLTSDRETKTPTIKSFHYSTILKTEPAKSNWFELTNEILDQNFIQRYFRACESNDSIFFLEEKKRLDLMQCLSACRLIDDCERINFENETCKIYKKNQIA